MMNIGRSIQHLTYYLSEHPTVVTFRWSASQSWGATWSFLFTSISLYIALSLILHAVLPQRRPIPLGPIPALHSLSMAIISFTIFSGTLLSTAAEIHDTRWIWRQSKTPFQWLLCFPIGTRPSGRVFFWSYVFYLSRFLHLFRTFFSLLRHRKIPAHHLINHPVLIFSAFTWLEFSQSFQVLAIISTTLISSVMYGYRFWTAVGLPPCADFPFVLNCQVALLTCHVACHVGVLVMHFFKGGCNGIVALSLNSVLNTAILLPFVHFYLKSRLKSEVNENIRNVNNNDNDNDNECEKAKDI